MKTAVLIVEVPHDSDIDVVLEAIMGFGRTLKIGVKADIRWMPANPERHTNQGVIKIPHRRRQIMHARLPEPPRNPLKITAEDAAARRIRRRIEDIKDASRLERESLLDVWDLDPRELQ